MKTIMLAFALLLSAVAHAQTVHTWEIEPDSTIRINIEKATGLKDTTYVIGKYFQMFIAGADRDSFTVSWTTIKETGEIKNKGIQRMPNILLQLVGDTIAIDDLNGILTPKWGIIATRRID